MNSEGTDNKAFKFIKNFVDAVAAQYGTEHRPVLLYSHLLSKTTTEHKTAISKNVLAFQEFMITNREAVYNKDVSSLVDTKISYSDKVFVDINEVFRLAADDAKTVKVLWIHILLISAVVDPAGKAKQILSQNPGKKENNFMADVLDKVEKAVPKDASPQDAFSSIMSSGIFTDIMGSMTKGLDSGEFDIQGLLGSATSAMKGLSPDGEGAPLDMGKMMGEMMKGLSPPSDGEAKEGAPPDMGKMMGEMMKGLSGKGGEGAPPDLSKMMGDMLKTLTPEGSEEGAPDMGKMMGEMLKTLSPSEGDGNPPDLGKMIGSMMATNTESENTGGIDLSKMMGAMMKGEQPDLSSLLDNSTHAPISDSGLPEPPTPGGSDPLKMMASMMGVPELPKSKPTDLSRLTRLH
jgi:hypothetical protein